MVQHSITTHRGVNLDLTYIEGMDRIKEGMRCDGVEAREDGKLIGYIKFDYTSEALMTAENPTIWAYASRYGFGLSVRDSLTRPLDELTTDELYDLLCGITISRLAGPSMLRANAPDRAREIWSSVNTFSAIKPTEKDRRVLLGCLKAAERGQGARRAAAGRADFIDYAGKPFVSYVNTKDNYSRQMSDDNSRRGVGTVLYRAASEWIAERGLAPGLYASKLQSDSAKAIWDRFEARGWVVADGDRRYLDAAKMVD